MRNAITGPIFSPAFFVQLQFAAPGSSPTTVSVWSGLQAITTSAVNGTLTTFTGLGSLLSIGQIEEGSTVTAQPFSLGFSGLDPTFLPDALTDNQLGLPATVWIAAMSGGVPIASPIIIWSGATDQARFVIGPDAVDLTIDCESILSVLDIAIDRRYTPQDQQMIYPGDLGLAFVYQLIDETLYWGQNRVGSGPTKQGAALA